MAPHETLPPGAPGATAPPASATRTVLRALCPVRHWRRTIVLAALAAIIGGAWWLWDQVLQDRFVARNWGIVEEGRIYRSGMLSPYMVGKMLRLRNIKVIVSLVNEERRVDQQAERDAAAELGVQRILLPLVGDGTGNILHYAKAIAAIVQADKEGKGVLVHCVAGTHRTGGVVCMYRVFVQGWRPEDAWRELADYGFSPKRPVLREYLNENMAELARLLVEMGVIARVPQPLPRL